MDNHRGSPTLTLLIVHNVLNVLNALNVVRMPKDSSLASWALFFFQGRDIRNKTDPKSPHGTRSEKKKI